MTEPKNDYQAIHDAIMAKLNCSDTNPTSPYCGSLPTIPGKRVVVSYPIAVPIQGVLPDIHYYTYVFFMYSPNVTNRTGNLVLLKADGRTDVVGSFEVTTVSGEDTVSITWSDTVSPELLDPYLNNAKEYLEENPHLIAGYFNLNS